MFTIMPALGFCLLFLYFLLDIYTYVTDILHQVTFHDLPTLYEYAGDYKIHIKHCKRSKIMVKKNSSL